MKCNACGAEVDNSALFCHLCGDRMDELDNQGETVETEPVETEPVNTEPVNSEPVNTEPVETQAESPVSPTVPPRTHTADQFRKIVSKPGSSGGSVEEEAVLWEGRYSAKAMVGVWIISGLFTVLALIVGAWVSYQGWIPGKWLWLGVVASILAVWIFQFAVYLYRRIGVRYRLTTHRFFHETGILRHTTDTIEVIDMIDIKFEQKLWERLTGVGTIHIHSSDKSDPTFAIRGVERAREAFGIIDKARQEERMRRGVHIEHI